MQKFKLKPLVVISFVVVALAAGAFFYVSARKPEATAAGAQTAPKPALTVTAALPETTRLPIRLSANGNIAAWQEAVIGAESTGLRLTEVRVNVGDVVKAGQVLATFSTDSVQADVAQARASLLEAQANAADAAGNAERARSLQSSGALSTQQINQYQTTEKTAKARAEAAQAVLGAQQLRGRQTQVLAPDSGVISARTATVGSVVGSGAELFRMIRQGRLEWRAEVTSAELGRIAIGTPVSVVPASGGELRGRVRMVAPSVDPQTRAALVYVDLPAMTRASAGLSSPAGAAEPALPGRRRSAPSGGSAAHEVASVGAALPGMFARGEFELGATDALTVPQRALVVRDGFNYLFRLGEGNRVSQLKVQTGRLAGDRVEVVSGLPADTRIVVNGAGFLNDGDLVRVAQESESNTASAQSVPASAAIKTGATP
ncbi:MULTISPECIES: efflux RND transporter periplasmic adaptor subunit [unclassified Polaromonas]|uniref:efflux RND transporter periplasmic adaptor subunit n=1 Tax=unclassified Polaromonas TaxID=2638319 RepID=UPI0018CB196C|nr:MULTISPECIES: efflux RND transporter periplasmic adaptor subunit [unclassified Polaromonas]MBG6073459.1 RND family efflux transporter MFP subunit [Polaromonas sp. CG_9.7]MBG6115495.1 RND family efflux transporter MFP subunit [Polaromonas sp. CG_9.2]MDH6183305.1 RND family efflux transporter MFP subunit [Polaromonas sp. CG_23.6]